MCSSGRYEFTGHARQRMHQRGAKEADVLQAIATAAAAVHQPDADTWRVQGGVDRDRDDLTVVVAIRSNIVVITVF